MMILSLLIKKGLLNNWAFNFVRHINSLILSLAMLLRTHIAIAIFFILLLVPSVQSKFMFVVLALIFTILPDIDSRFSMFGRRKISRVLMFFTRHRGITHSFIFLIVVTLLILLFSSQVALAFFLGYGVHLFADSFTVQGIRPFYPLKIKSTGSVRTGKRGEVIIFVIFILLDVFLFIQRVF